MIFDSCEAIGAALAEKLEKMSQHATVVPAGTDPPSRLTAVRECTSVPERKCRGVIYLGDLDVKDKENGSLGDLEVKDNENVPDFAAARDSGWGGVLDVVHALTQSEGSDAPRLWLVTRGAQAVGDRPMPLSLAQSPVWGLARVIAAEHPTLGCSRIDLDPEDQGNDADRLFEEISWNHGEDQVAYRGGERRAARLRRLRKGESDGLELPRGQPYRLEITSRGELDNVALRPVTRQRPGPAQIEIQVRATGLNFRDVLNVLNLYPGDPGPLGGECSGVVVAVGRESTASSREMR